MPFDQFDPDIRTSEQQIAPEREYALTEQVRAALKSNKPNALGDLIRPDTQEPLFPNLAARNAELRRR